MAFDDAAISTLWASLLSHAQNLGRFENVIGYEPLTAPTNGLTCAIWVESIRPAPRVSGLAATAGVVVFSARIFNGLLQKPPDNIDPVVMDGTCKLLGEYSGNFTLGGTVIDVDLLGATGAALSAQAGYVQIGGTWFRVMTVTLPVVIDAMFGQAP